MIAQAASTRLQQLLLGTPYLSYEYSYPHKTAYHRLDPPIPISSLWSAERDRKSLFLYVHVPFCEMRCGFCNLFTTANPDGDFISAYLDTLARQAARVRAALDGGSGDIGFARFAVGGGTPTLLEPPELDRLFDIAERMGARPSNIPVSVECSPKTVTKEKLSILRARGADRLSIGVQSFLPDEAAAAGRPQRASEVESALTALREAGFPTLNIDLIYGIANQTISTFHQSLRAALRYRPEELYLYPLYVRPLTGLGKSPRHWDDERLALYRAGRDFLLSEGYTQISMRMFRAPWAPSLDGLPLPADDPRASRARKGPVYCCQEDGMVGLGCGARSYTERVHYASEFAVGARGVREILSAWVRRSDNDFDIADWGFRLDEEDRRRRFAILSLLGGGLEYRAYHRRFGSHVDNDIPELSELAPLGLAQGDGERIVLTAAGTERADVIGPWLHSRRVQTLMDGCELR